MASSGGRPDMYADVEETLNRELREVADGLHVPALPPLPKERPRSWLGWQSSHGWQPWVVAAAVVLIVAGVVAGLAAALGGGLGREPLPPSSSRTEPSGPTGPTGPTNRTEAVGTTPPTVP